MSFIKKIKTKTDIDILKYDKSITIDGQVVFNGYPFNDDNINVIKNAINNAFIAGKEAKTDEIKKVLNI